jgi:lipase ATG15
VNDNRLFSCCCAHVDWTWTDVCGCYRGGWKCDQTCTENALVDSQDLFYPIGMVHGVLLLAWGVFFIERLRNLYNNPTRMYPDSVIWVFGRSLGGALASLIGVTFGAPVVDFESPGEAMVAQPPTSGPLVSPAVPTASSCPPNVY